MPDDGLDYSLPAQIYKIEPKTHKCTRCDWVGSNRQRYGGAKLKHCPKCVMGKVHRV